MVWWQEREADQLKRAESRPRRLADVAKKGAVKAVASPAARGGRGKAVVAPAKGKAAALQKTSPAAKGGNIRSAFGLPAGGLLKLTDLYKRQAQREEEEEVSIEP